MPNLYHTCRRQTQHPTYHHGAGSSWSSGPKQNRTSKQKQALVVAGGECGNSVGVRGMGIETVSATRPGASPPLVLHVSTTLPRQIRWYV